MATGFGDVVERGELVVLRDEAGPTSESSRLNEFILAAALAFLAGLFLSEWANRQAIRSLSDDNTHLEHVLLQNEDIVRLARPRLAVLRLMEAGEHPTPVLQQIKEHKWDASGQE